MQFYQDKLPQQNPVEPTTSSTKIGIIGKKQVKLLIKKQKLYYKTNHSHTWQPIHIRFTFTHTNRLRFTVLIICVTVLLILPIAKPVSIACSNETGPG